MTPCAQLWAGDTVFQSQLTFDFFSQSWNKRSCFVHVYTFFSRRNYLPEGPMYCNVLYRMFVPCERLCTLYVAVWTLAWCYLILKTHRVISRYHILLHCSTIFCLSQSYTWNPNNLVQCQCLTIFWCVIQHFSWTSYQKGTRKRVWIGHAAIWSLSQDMLPNSASISLKWDWPFYLLTFCGADSLVNRM